MLKKKLKSEIVVAIGLLVMLCPLRGCLLCGQISKMLLICKLCFLMYMRYRNQTFTPKKIKW